MDLNILELCTKDFSKVLKKNNIDTLKKIKDYLDDKYYNTGQES